MIPCANQQYVFRRGTGRVSSENLQQTDVTSCQIIFLSNNIPRSSGKFSCTSGTTNLYLAKDDNYISQYLQAFTIAFYDAVSKAAVV